MELIGRCLQGTDLEIVSFILNSTPIRHLLGKG